MLAPHKDRSNLNAASHFDGARCTDIARDFRLSTSSVFDEDEALGSAGCGFRSTLAVAPVFAWVRRLPDTETKHVELCETCYAAAGGPAMLPEPC
jgi:hypothetical protein